MRIKGLLSVAAIGFFALHCSSDPASTGSDEAVTENHPGNLLITAPERAAFIEGKDGAEVEIKGTGASSELTINGQKATVAPDGSFTAKVKGVAGLNLITAVDGEARLETPFLFGHFVPATTAVGKAVALDLGKDAISGSAPTTLTSIANKYLKSSNLLSTINGKTFSGSASVASFSFKVKDGKYADATVGLGTANAGIAVSATVKNLVVDGTLTVKVIGQTVSHDVTISATKATVQGDASLDVASSTGALAGAMPKATVKLDGFKWDDGNLGFPCCVDSIISSNVRPQIEDAIAQGVRDEVPKALALTLDGLGLPKSLDLSSAGLTQPVEIAARFDGASFDANGGTLTAQVLFGGVFPGGSAGSKAPGWLQIGGQEIGERASALGISFSTDAVNQLFFAAWGAGGLALKIPDTPPVSKVKLTPKLPPVLTFSDDKTIKISIGEMVVEASLSDTAFTAAITASQDLVPTSDGQNLILTPKGDPALSITWLKADDVADGVRNVIKAAVSDQITKFLKPMKIPVPAFSLDKLGKDFAGQSIGIESAAIAVDKKLSRVGISGDLSLAQTPPAAPKAAAK